MLNVRSARCIYNDDDEDDDDGDEDGDKDGGEDDGEDDFPRFLETICVHKQTCASFNASCYETANC